MHHYSISDLKTIISVHGTARGSACGGDRLWNNQNDLAAHVDTMSLSFGMSLKNALAGPSFGGCRTVIVTPPGEFDHMALFGSFGNVFACYIAADDIDSTTADNHG